MTTLLLLSLALAAVPADSTPTEVLPAYGDLEPGAQAPWLAGWTLAETVWNIDQAAAGERTILVFWATWCAPCREGLRRLAAAEARLAAAGVAVVLVNLDARQAAVTRFLAEDSLPFPCVLDPFQVGTRGFFGLTASGADTLALPRTVILDGDRRVTAILGREGDDYLDLLLQEWDPDQVEVTPTRR